MEDIKLRGITKSRVKTDVELQLRKAGIKVVSKDEYLKSPDAALEVQILAAVTRNRLVVYFTSVDLVETANLDRDNSIRILASSWMSRAEIGWTSLKNISKLRNEVLDLVDEFINDYYAANTE